MTDDLYTEQETRPTIVAFVGRLNADRGIAPAVSLRVTTSAATLLLGDTECGTVWLSDAGCVRNINLRETAPVGLLRRINRSWPGVSVV